MLLRNGLPELGSDLRNKDEEGIELVKKEEPRIGLS
jgi:hypothetical protein